VATASGGFRAVLDVAIDVAPEEGVPVYDSFDSDGATPWLRMDGTSLVAPLWAGVVAITDQGRELNGLDTLDGRHDTLPYLYALPASDFHDITTGNNGYAATPADLATALSTADQRTTVRVADLNAPVSPNRRGVATAFGVAPLGTEQVPPPGAGAATARFAGSLRERNSSSDENDLFWLLAGDSPENGHSSAILRVKA
jgi:hypothetical protein